MTREEFTACMAFLSSGSGKPMGEQQAEVYFDLLGDLPCQALEFAVKRALAESAYPTLPTIGVLRRLAVGAMNGSDREPTADEAWELVRRAISAFGWSREIDGIKSLPDGPVRRAAECLGWQSMCDCTETEIQRAQYRRAYETLQARGERQRLLPAPMIAMLEQIGQLPPMPEMRGYDHRNAWQVIQDEAVRRRALPTVEGK